MSDDSSQQISCDRDNHGRAVRIETRSNRYHLPRIESLRRLSNNFGSERQSSESTIGKKLEKKTEFFVIYIRILLVLFYSESDRISDFYLYSLFIFQDTSGAQAVTISSGDETTCNSPSTITDHESSADVTDGASSPDQTSASAPTLSSDDE